MSCVWSLKSWFLELKKETAVFRVRQNLFFLPLSWITFHSPANLRLVRCSSLRILEQGGRKRKKFLRCCLSVSLVFSAWQSVVVVDRELYRPAFFWLALREGGVLDSLWRFSGAFDKYFFLPSPVMCSSASQAFEKLWESLTAISRSLYVFFVRLPSAARVRSFFDVAWITNIQTIRRVDHGVAAKSYDSLQKNLEIGVFEAAASQTEAR